MTIQRSMIHLDAAIDAESWQWLQDNAPLYADALLAEVRAGATPEQIRVYAQRRTQRDMLSRRLQQAAAHLARELAGEGERP